MSIVLWVYLCVGVCYVYRDRLLCVLVCVSYRGLCALLY